MTQAHEIILLIPPLGLEPRVFTIQSVTCSHLHHRGLWMPRQDSHLQSPDSESGDLLIRPLGSGWGSRNRTYDLSVNSGLLCHSAIPHHLAHCCTKPPRSDLNG